MAKDKLFAVIIIILFIHPVFAINLEIEKQKINEVVISGINNPAKFLFTIENLGATDHFEIYTLVSIDMTPRGNFKIESGETRIIEVAAYIPENVKSKHPGFYTFNYKLRGQETGIREDILTVKITSLNTAFGIEAENIVPDSNKINIILTNKENFYFENLEIRLNSEFFEYSDTINLEPYEERLIEIPINKESLRGLEAGRYILNANLKLQNASANLESTIKFLERSETLTDEESQGLLITDKIIEKINEGNTNTITGIVVKKDVLSRLYTTFSLTPDRVERKGLFVYYTWQQELKPGESFRVRVRTNWIIPFAILLLIIVVVFALTLYTKKDIKVKKRVVYVKTKGGEFALKVIISLRAKKYVENIKVVDKLPPIVKVYERYGAVTPDKVDEKNRRLEWNIENLNKDEEVLLSYIVYSKIRVMGKFGLPPTAVIYEREGKVEEAESNKVYFITEARKPEKNPVE